MSNASPCTCSMSTFPATRLPSTPSETAGIVPHETAAKGAATRTGLIALPSRPHSLLCVPLAAPGAHATGEECHTAGQDEKSSPWERLTGGHVPDGLNAARNDVDGVVAARRVAVGRRGGG